MNSALILGAAEGHHIVNELPIPTIWYGIIVFAVLMACLAVTMSFRSVGLRHAAPTTAVQHASGHGHGTGSHGARH